MKVNAKNSTEKSIAKSLLNNLLCRFGIDLNKYETSLVTEEEFEDMLVMRDIKNEINIDGKYLVTYKTGLNYDLKRTRIRY